MKKVEEVKEDFKGIDLDRPDDVIIDVDDEAKLARIVNSFTRSSQDKSYWKHFSFICRSYGIRFDKLLFLG